MYACINRLLCIPGVNSPCVDIDALLSLLMKFRGDTPNKLVLEAATELLPAA